MLWTPLAILPGIETILGIVAAVVAWRGSDRSPGAQSFAWWLVLNISVDLTALGLALQGINNHQLIQVYRLCSLLLLGLTAYRLLPGQPQRRLVAWGTAAFVVFWLVMTFSVESTTEISRFTAPGEKVAGVLLGLLLVAESIRSGDDSPLHRPEAWIGIGLVLASAPSLVTWPVMAQMIHTSNTLPRLLNALSGLFTDMALILWCVPYLKKNVTWTR